MSLIPSSHAFASELKAVFGPAAEALGTLLGFVIRPIGYAELSHPIKSLD